MGLCTSIDVLIKALSDECIPKTSQYFSALKRILSAGVTF